MMTMNDKDRVKAARKSLTDADHQFDEGNDLKGSQKMWDAAAHAVIAVAQSRVWRHNKHRHLKIAVRRLARELGDANLELGFAAAERLHANFYHGFMNENAIARDRRAAREFVETALAALE